MKIEAEGVAYTMKRGVMYTEEGLRVPPEEMVLVLLTRIVELEGELNAWSEWYHLENPRHVFPAPKRRQV